MLASFSIASFANAATLSIKDFGASFEKQYSKDVKYPQKFLGSTFSSAGNVKQTNLGSSFKVKIELPKNSAGDMVVAWCENTVGDVVIGKKVSFSGVLSGDVYTYDEGGVGIYLKDCTTQSKQNENEKAAASSVSSDKFGFKKYRIGMMKSELTNLGECINPTGAKGVELCKFAKSVSTQLAPLSIMGIKDTIAGQDAIVSKVIFVDGKLAIVGLDLPDPDPSSPSSEIKWQQLSEALSTKFERISTAPGQQEFTERDNQTHRVLLHLNQQMTEYQGRAMMIISIGIEFSDANMSDDILSRVQSARQNAEEQEKRKAANDM